MQLFCISISFAWYTYIVVLCDAFKLPLFCTHLTPRGKKRWWWWWWWEGLEANDVFASYKYVMFHLPWSSSGTQLAEEPHYLYTHHHHQIRVHVPSCSRTCGGRKRSQFVVRQSISVVVVTVNALAIINNINNKHNGKKRQGQGQNFSVSVIIINQFLYYFIKVQQAGSF